MVLLSIRILGEWSAVDYRGNGLSIGNRRTQALIVYLALKMGNAATLKEIGQLFFDDPNATDQVREVIRDLRYALRYLPLDLLVDTGESLRFERESVDIDARRFNDLIAAPSLNSIRKAADIYRGDLLTGFVSGMPALDAWFAEKRLTFRRAAVAIFSNLLTALIRAGWWEEATEVAGRVVSLDPSQEVVHRTLMRLHLEQGRPDAALRRYRECAEILRRDYGSLPSPETERLREEIERAVQQTPAPPEMRSLAIDRPVLVLLVEDDLVSAALLEGYLLEAGYEVVTVKDGGDALLELGRRAFDVLVLDINIPTLSGMRVFEIMVQKGIETPALFITGMTGTEVETRSLEMGAAGFLRKPILKDVLLQRLRGILHRSRRDAASDGS